MSFQEIFSATRQQPRPAAPALELGFDAIAHQPTTTEKKRESERGTFNKKRTKVIKATPPTRV
jgi:hypothetical protein